MTSPKVAMIVAHRGFRDEEYQLPRDILAAAGAVTWRFARYDTRLYVTFLAFATILSLYSPWIKNGGALGPVVVSALSALAVLWGAWLGSHPERAHAAAFIALAIVFTGASRWPLPALSSPWLVET